uniref:Uncharacterized protein n=1 Tax=Anguilla anguilla TaxID=7936 RepID=A0A0E9Q390_ANGAN
MLLPHKMLTDDVKQKNKQKNRLQQDTQLFVICLSYL